MEAATQTRLLDNYIAGAWTAASGAEALDVTNPATGEVLARVPLSSSADLDRAVKAAREALPVWRGVSVIARARLLFGLREGLSNRREDLARSVTTEMGKTIGDARAEVARMVEMVEAACAIPTTSRTSLGGSTPRRSASPWACVPRSCRSTSRPWSRSGSCPSRSGAGTHSC